MITYEVKITVQPEIKDRWLAFMQQEHVPELIATGLVKSFHILQASDTQFSFHYHMEAADYERYQKEFAPALKKHPMQHFEPGSFSAERTVYTWI